MVKNNLLGSSPKIRKFEFKLKFNVKTILLALLVLFFVLPFLLSPVGLTGRSDEIDIPDAIADIKEGKVDKVVINGEKLLITYKDQTQKTANKEGGESFREILDSYKVDPSTVSYSVANQDLSKAISDILGVVLPLILMAVFFFFIFRQARGAQDTLFSFGQSRAKLFAKGKQNVTFTDVAGVDEAKKELEEVVDFLKHPGKYRAMGARTPKGVLLFGPAGVGKTLLAKALAGEAAVPFFSMAGSEFMEMLVGVGASVTGDTPILVKEGKDVRLLSIGDFVDGYYRDGEEEKIVKVDGVKTLGFQKKKTGFWGTKSKSSDKAVFERSTWQGVSGVYRHKVNKIYEIHYLGGLIKTTGDHSVFVRTQGWILPKRVDELRPGDVLVDLPINVRRWDSKTRRTLHEIKTHYFSNEAPEIYLDFWGEDKGLRDRYEYAFLHRDEMYQYEIASQIGVSQTTVSNWQRGIYVPQLLSRKLVKMDLPDQIPVTKDLMKLFGFYTAEGRSNHGLHFVFGIHEGDLHRVCIKLMKEIFWANPKLEETEDNTLRIIYHSAHLGRFFERYCGTGSHNKHLPSFIWDLPREYFLAFLEGYTKGDGYQTRTGKLCATSVSRQLILELAWLCSMHGIKAGIKHEMRAAGRVIRRKPLPPGESWTLIIGKTSNPFLTETVLYPYQIKRAIVKKIVEKPFDGFVYDLCGVENEAFFGGEKPVLLHNSRVRDLFAQAKASAPSIIFIDEIDAIGRQRGFGIAGGHDEREQTLNQILVEMDGFTPNDNVLVVAASVSGDTPIAVKEDGEVRLVSIGEFIDQFYLDGTSEGEVELSGVECLGFEKKASFGNLTHKNLYPPSQKTADVSPGMNFGNSAFKGVRSVFRHKVKEIYEIDYLGGKTRATGNHSVFVRDKFGIKPKAVSDLQKGDILVDLPYKVNRTKKSWREIRAHKFDDSWSLTLPLLDPTTEYDWQAKYQFAIAAYSEGESQQTIGQKIDVSQKTVGDWLQGTNLPRAISERYTKNPVPFDKVKVTPKLCRLLGYYVAEVYSRWELDFCFNVNERDLILDVSELMQEIFGLTPRVRNITPGAVNLVYNCAAVSNFFARYSGRDARNKHVPSFLFEAPYSYFREFLRGVWLGDGYEDKQGRGEITTTSRRLALEINWIARMHGIKTYLGGFVAKEGRRIADGKPLRAVRAWRVGWGKAANPFNSYLLRKKFPAKRAIVRRVTKLPFDGFVYDLCGVENEAFFGGESPVLLHNTNRGDLLDPALLRPGRFDRRVVLDMPDKEGRVAILKIHSKGKKFTKEINWERVAERTVGFSGADIENMLNEAAILAARAGREEITNPDIEEAATKVKLGPAKKRFQSEEDKKMTAYHEAGHAIVTHNLPHMDPVHKISIVARGMSLGHTLIPPAVDRTHETRSRLVEQIVAILGGRAAEEIVFGEMTSGASNDIEQATRVARAMVVDLGMSELGPVNLGPQVEYGDMGRAWVEPTQVSPAMQEKVDNEVSKIITGCYKQALLILKKERKTLDKVAEALVKVETLEREEFEKIVGTKPKLALAKA